jgi:hypothetical protein
VVVAICAVFLSYRPRDSSPQFVRYNAALRRWPPEDYEKMMKADNLYTTTISVLVSAVQKIARSMKLPEGLRLFRGLGGLMDLPTTFFTSDARGRKGFVEWGFMSTTSKEQVTGGCEMRKTVTGREGKSIHGGDRRQEYA